MKKLKNKYVLIKLKNEWYYSDKDVVIFDKNNCNGFIETILADKDEYKRYALGVKRKIEKKPVRTYSVSGAWDPTPGGYDFIYFGTSKDKQEQLNSNRSKAYVAEQFFISLKEFMNEFKDVVTDDDYDEDND